MPTNANQPDNPDHLAFFFSNRWSGSIGSGLSFYGFMVLRPFVLRLRRHWKAYRTVPWKIYTVVMPNTSMVSSRSSNCPICNRGFRLLQRSYQNAWTACVLRFQARWGNWVSTALCILYVPYVDITPAASGTQGQSLNTAIIPVLGRSSIHGTRSHEACRISSIHANGGSFVGAHLGWTYRG